MGRVRATGQEGKAFHSKAVKAAKLLMLKPNNFYVIKPSGNDSRSVGVSSDGRPEEFMS